MESTDKKFYSYHNDEQYSRIFNDNIPSLVIKIEISDISSSPQKDMECLPEIAEGSVTRVPEKGKLPLSNEDFPNSVNNTKQKISSSQLPESLLHKDESLQEFSVEFAPTITEQREGPFFDENFINGAKEIQLQIDASEIPVSLPQNADYLNDVSIRGVHNCTVKEKMPIADENFLTAIKQIEPKIGAYQLPELSPQNNEKVSVEFVPIISQKGKYLIPDTNFLHSMEEIKLQIGPNLVPESLSQNNDCSKQIPDKSVPVVSGKEKSIPDDDFLNAEIIKCEIDVNQILEPLPQNDESLQEASVESVPTTSQKRKCLTFDENFLSSIKKTKLQSSASQTTKLPPQCKGYLKEVPVEPLFSISSKEKRSILDEDFQDSVKRIKRQIDANQTLESLPQYDESLQEVSVKSAPATSQKRKEPTLVETFTSVVNKNKLQIDANEVPESLPQNCECLKEIPAESVPIVSGKRKRSITKENYQNAEKIIRVQIGAYQTSEAVKNFISDNISMNPMKENKVQVGASQTSETVPSVDESLREVSVESRATSSGKKKRRDSVKDFKNVVKKIRRQRNPKMQLASSTVRIMNNLICKFNEIFDEELITLRKIRKVKTLTVKQLEYVTKLCLSKGLYSRATAYGRMAVERALKNIR